MLLMLLFFLPSLFFVLVGLVECKEMRWLSRNRILPNG
jgi:hypothetical protein